MNTKSICRRLALSAAIGLGVSVATAWAPLVSGTIAGGKRAMPDPPAWIRVAPYHRTIVKDGSVIVILSCDAEEFDAVNSRDRPLGRVASSAVRQALGSQRTYPPVLTVVSGWPFPSLMWEHVFDGTSQTWTNRGGFGVRRPPFVLRHMSSHFKYSGETTLSGIPSVVLPYKPVWPWFGVNVAFWFACSAFAVFGIRCVLPERPVPKA